MKLITVCCLIFLIPSLTYGQELASKNGLTLSYEATKKETTKKTDKWELKITVSNTSGGDLYFSASPGMSAVSIDASYARIDIPNTKGLLTMNVKFFRAKLVDGLKSSDHLSVFRIPAGTIVESLNTAVGIGETPVVTGTIIITPKSLAEVTGESGPTPVATAPVVAAPTATVAAPVPPPAAASDAGTITVLPRASVASGQKLLLKQAIAMPAYPEIRLVLDGTGNLLLYSDGGKTSLWSSNTAGKGVSYGEMEAEGNFVLKNAAGAEVWSTGTAGNPGSMLVLGQEGTLAVFTKAFSSVWSAP